MMTGISIDRDHTQWREVIDHSKDSNGTWFLSRPVHFAWAEVQLVIRPAQERLFLYGKSFFICSQGKRSTISRINLYLVLRMCQPLCRTLQIQSLLQFSQGVCEMEFFLNFLCHRCQLGLPDFHRWFTLLVLHWHDHWDMHISHCTVPHSSLAQAFLKPGPVPSHAVLVITDRISFLLTITVVAEITQIYCLTVL